MKKSFLHLVGNLAPILSGLLTAPLTARSLGVDARGQLTLILLVSAVITVVGNFGLSWLARADVAANAELAQPWNRLGLRAAFSLMPVALATGVLLSWRMELDPLEILAVMILFTLSSLSAARGVTANVLIALGRHDFFGRANLAMTLAVVTSVVVSFVFGWLNLAVALLATAIGFIVQMVILGAGFRIALRTMPEQVEVRRSRKIKFRAVLPRALRSWISQLSEMLVIRSDVVLVSVQGSSFQLGLYSVVGLIPQISYQVYSTLIQQSYARNPKMVLATRTTLLWLLCAFCGIVLAAMAVPVAYVLIPIIFGTSFEGARDYLLPGAAIAIGLATLAPIVNDVALRRRPAPYFGALAALGTLTAVVVGSVLGIEGGLYTLATLFVVLSSGYVTVLNRGALGWIRLGLIASLFRAR